MATRSDVGVHIISAVDHAVLGRWFEFVPVTLWAEHGLWHRRPDERRWRRTQALESGLDRGLARIPGAIHRQDSGVVRRRALDRVRVALRPDESRDRGCRARELFAVLQEAGDAMGFTVTLKPSSIEVRPGELSRERTIEKILAADASAGRLVVFERPGKENGLRRVLRPSDVLVAIGAAAASSNHVLSSTRTVRDVLESAFETVGQDLEHARPDDRSFFSPAVSALPAVTTSLSVSPH